jgi:hypothetical protein
MTHTTSLPIAILATIHPAGRGAGWRNPQRVEINHDPSRGGVWATVENRRRLFCLATGVELSATQKHERRWELREPARVELRSLFRLQ